jgi:hypothetical protein
MSAGETHRVDTFMTEDIEKKHPLSKLLENNNLLKNLKGHLLQDS